MHSIKVRTRKWLTATVVLIVGAAILILLQVGVPLPEVNDMTTIQGRMLNLAGHTFGWRFSVVYSNSRIKARNLYRGSFPDLLLVSGKYYDPAGNLRSRVINGNGFAFIFHENGKPSELTGYLRGIESGPHLLWDSEGQLLRAEFIDRSKKSGAVKGK